MGGDMELFFSVLDGARALTAFNGARFDIPFLEHKYGLDAKRVGAWRLKLFDVCEISCAALGCRFPLNKLLERNDIPCKTGSGKEAIKLWEEGKLEEVGEYCRQDTIKTWQVSQLPTLLLPVEPCEMVLQGGLLSRVPQGKD
jgi:hypothetical protein